MKLTCNYCKKNFINRHRRDYCSRSCYSKYRISISKNLISSGRICTSCKIHKDAECFYFLKKYEKLSSECRECVVLRSTKYAQENRDRVLKKCRQYYYANKEKSNNRNKERNKAIRKAIFDHYGGKCICCGEIEDTFLTIDHINNDGNVQRKTQSSGGMFYRWIMKNNYPDNLQILCWNCNHGKYKIGMCPHQMKEG